MIGNCDCCDRTNVPGFFVTFEGGSATSRYFVCDICQSEPEDERAQTDITSGAVEVVLAVRDAAVIAAFVSALAVWAMIGTGVA